MPLRIKRLGRCRGDCNQPDPPGDVAAGGLKMSELLRNTRLAGSQTTLVQGISVVEQAHYHLQPFALGSSKFFDF